MCIDTYIQTHSHIKRGVDTFFGVVHKLKIYYFCFLPLHTKKNNASQLARNIYVDTFRLRCRRRCHFDLLSKRSVFQILCVVYFFVPLVPSRSRHCPLSLALVELGQALRALEIVVQVALGVFRI